MYKSVYWDMCWRRQRGGPGGYEWCATSIGSSLFEIKYAQFKCKSGIFVQKKKRVFSEISDFAKETP